MNKVKKVIDEKQLCADNQDNICDNYCDEDRCRCEGCCCSDAQEKFLEDYAEENEESNNEMKFSVDIESLKNSIVASVKKDVISSISNDLKGAIIKQVYEEAAKPQIELIKEVVKETVNNMVKEEILSYYENQKITIGGGFMNDAEEYTIKEYTQNILKEIITDKTFKSPNRKGSTNFRNWDSFKIEDYLIENIINHEVKTILDKEIKKSRKQVDQELKTALSTQLNEVLSEVAMGVLQSSSAYASLTKNLLPLGKTD